MKVSKRIFLFSLVACLLAACAGKEPISMTEYQQWFSAEHGYIKEKTVNGLTYRVQYRPAELMMLNDLEEGKKYSRATIDSLRATYADSKYFLLEIGTNDGQRIESKLDVHNMGEFKEKIEALAFDMSPTVDLVVNGDTLAPSLYHYERGFELATKQRFLFAFPVGDGTRDSKATFIFWDDIFGTARHKYQFNINDEDLPELPVRLNA